MKKIIKRVLVLYLILSCFISNIYAKTIIQGNFAYIVNDKNEIITGFYQEDNKLYYCSPTGILTYTFELGKELVDPYIRAVYLAEQCYDSNLVKYSQDQRAFGLNFDCSSFIGRLYKRVGINFFDENLACLSQLNYFIDNGKIIEEKNVEIGDLVYFGDSIETANHVGIINNIDNKGRFYMISCKKENNGLHKEQVNKNKVFLYARP